MTTCKGCGRRLDAADLVRHERGQFVVVHCPDCKCLVGRYNRHGDGPKTDHLKDQSREQAPEREREREE